MNKKIKVKKKDWLNIVSYFLTGMIVGFLLLGLYEKNKNVNFVHMNDLIKLENGNVNKNSFIDIKYNPFEFALYDKSFSKYYIVQDEEYMYIAYISDDLLKEINSKDLENESYRITGHTKVITEDIKKLAIEVYNETVNVEAINYDNFDSYFGSIYLDTSNCYNYSEICFFSAFVLFLINVYILYMKRGKWLYGYK